jgi:hypothetical protein
VATLKVDEEGYANRTQPPESAIKSATRRAAGEALTSGRILTGISQAQAGGPVSQSFLSSNSLPVFRLMQCSTYSYPADHINAAFPQDLGVRGEEHGDSHRD